MTKKIIILIFVLTFASLQLLSIRHAQIKAVHKMTVLHQKITKQKIALDALRFEIETECSKQMTEWLTLESLEQ